MKKYKSEIRIGRNGAIVMNCNPYTLGHDYLIETAAEQVDNLYIFVVEEDKSFFSFKDRYKLVKENTKRFNNVIVVPSGDMILSANTFGAYFVKEEYCDIKVDASGDLKLFGLAVAPFFNITTRFVGEEPFDKVTLQYNDSMLAQLPAYGVDVKVIPRKKNDEKEIISATSVRKLLKEQNWDAIAKFVPEITYEYLKQNFSK